MSVSLQAAQTELDHIDRQLTSLSELVKVSSKKTRDMYEAKIDSLLEQRYTLTND